MKRKFAGMYCKDCGLVNLLAGLPAEIHWQYYMSKPCAVCNSVNAESFTVDCRIKKDGFPKIASLRKELGMKVWLP